MRPSLLLLSCTAHLLSLCSLTAADDVADFWKWPAGNLGNYGSSSFQAGTVQVLLWNGWTSTDIINGYETLCTMGVRPLDALVSDIPGMNTTVTQHVNITTAGSFNWAISDNIPDAAFSKSVNYELWFQPDDGGEPIGSPFINIRPRAGASSSSTSSSASTSSSTPTSTPTPTNTQTPVPRPKGLSSGAKGGIGFAAAIVGVALIGAAIFFYARWSKARKSQASAPEYHTVSPPKAGDYIDNTIPTEFPTEENPTELADDYRAELANTQR